MTSIAPVIVLAIAVVCEYVSAADTARTQAMLLGTYHFSNPGKDIHNVEGGRRAHRLSAWYSRRCSSSSPLSYHGYVET